MLFGDRKHIERYLELTSLCDYDERPEFAVPCYLFTSNDSIFSKVQKYIKNEKIDFTKLIQNDEFSSIEKFIVKLAVHLFDTYITDCPSLSPVMRLDSRFYPIFEKSLYCYNRRINITDCAKRELLNKE